jgi:hypothetical protein
MNWIEYVEKWPQCNLRCYPSIWLMKLRKTTKTVSQNSQSPGRGLTQTSPNTLQHMNVTFHFSSSIVLYKNVQKHCFGLLGISGGTAENNEYPQKDC